MDEFQGWLPKGEEQVSAKGLGKSPCHLLSELDAAEQELLTLLGFDPVSIDLLQYQIEEVLKTAYNNIIAPDIEKTTAKGGSEIAKRGEDSRVLHFKSGDDIIEYNKEFGNPDTFAIMDNHIRQQSNEIAMMQLFGSNPEAGYNKLKELARADGMGSRQEAGLDRLWKVSSGQVDGDDVVNKADERLLTIGSTYRSIQIASKLGSATISSLADLGNIVLGSGYRDLSSINILGRSLKTLMQEVTSMGSAAENTLIANRIGVVSEFASSLRILETI